MIQSTSCDLGYTRSVALRSSAALTGPREERSRTIIPIRFLLCVLLLWVTIDCGHPSVHVDAFNPLIVTTPHVPYGSIGRQHEDSLTALNAVPAVSLLAGSLAGAIGVGIAHPLDTLKTKAQIWSLQHHQQLLLLQQQQKQAAEAASAPTNPSSVVQTAVVDVVQHLLQVGGGGGGGGGVVIGQGNAVVSILNQAAKDDPAVVANDYTRIKSNDEIWLIPSVAQYNELQQQNQPATTEMLLEPMTSHHGTLILKKPDLSSATVAVAFTQPLISPSVNARKDFSNEMVIALQHQQQQYSHHRSPNMLDIATRIWQEEGLAGFFGGVRIMMMGQGVIKAVSFTVNAMALNYMQSTGLLADPSHALSSTDAAPTFAMLVAAATSAGFVGSFLVNPIERVKVLMQSNGPSKYQNEWHCMQCVLQRQGWTDLLGRGLGATMAREVPSDAIYFTLYGYMMQTELAISLGLAAPLVFGAMAGCASWLPVYPIDVVKTIVQNASPDDDKDAGDNITTDAAKHLNRGAWQVAQDLYQESGISAFYDGLTPKLLRASIFHAVTFFVYDLVLRTLGATGGGGGISA